MDDANVERKDMQDLENGDLAKHHEAPPEDMSQLRQMLTSKSITDEQFERLFLSPRNVRPNPLKGFANPTPLAIMGFSTALTPLSAQLMGWRGAGGSAQSSVGASLTFGGMLLILAGLGEFLLGNTFPFLVFMGYGSHFLTFAITFIPFFNAVSAYTSGSPYEGTETQAQTAEFANSYGFYPLSMCILSLIFLLCSLRTNLVFFLIFVAATTGFGLASATFFHAGQGNMALSNNLLVGAGACFWAASMMGWYLLIAIMIPTMELPLPTPPVVDLSQIIKAKPPKEKM